MNKKNILINIFKNCLNILRDNEGLTGEKALRNLSYLLILKLIEPHLKNKINIDDYEHNLDFIPEESRIEYKNLQKFIYFSYLSSIETPEKPQLMIKIWDVILSNHPTTKKIFLKGNEFEIKHNSTYTFLFNQLNTIDLNQTEYDILGEAYEEVIKNIMTGKILGQYFTPPLIKKIMVKLLDPKIYPNGKIDTCGDPSMGTGGLLTTYLQYILQQAKKKNIKPDWNFIKNGALHGKEIEPNTYQLAVSNLLISTGHTFENLEKGDSIRNPITKKFDNIIANPPFGIKGLIYDDFQHPIKAKYLPIKTNNAVSLFIQAIIYMLNINGKCAIVMPSGQELYSKTNKTLITIRKYITQTCDLKEIIHLPPGIFTHTSINVCILYFIKKKEGTDILETKTKISKRKEEITKNYNFIKKTHETTKINFYEYDVNDNRKKLLIEVPIKEIINNKYSFNYQEYTHIKKVIEKKQQKEQIIVKTLEEICTFAPRSKRNAKYGNKDGTYPFFRSSLIVNSYIDEPDYEEESLIIGGGGNPNVNYGVKFSTTSDCYILQNKNKSLVNLKYIYYYLYHNLDMMKKLYIGLSIPHITKSNIEKITIPIPSIEEQQKIIKYLDFIYEKSNKTSLEIIELIKQRNKLHLNSQKPDNEKTLKELCEFLPPSKRNAKHGMKEGTYPFFRSSLIVNSYIDEPDYEEESLIIGGGGNPNVNYALKFSASNRCYILQNKNKLFVNLKYIYYYLYHNLDMMKKLYKGLTIPHITKPNLEQIKIPIPSLEHQQKIVKYLEDNEMLIKQLKKEIKTNKKEAKQLITKIEKL